MENLFERFLIRQTKSTNKRQMNVKFYRIVIKSANYLLQ